VNNIAISLSDRALIIRTCSHLRVDNVRHLAETFCCRFIYTDSSHTTVSVKAKTGYTRIP